MTQSTLRQGEGKALSAAVSVLLSVLLALSTFVSPGLAYAAGSIAAGSIDQGAAVKTEAVTALDITRAQTGVLTLKKGATYNLGAVASAGKITYKSSKPKVVKASPKGKLKALKVGSSTVTVKVGGVSKKVKVTVVKAGKFKAVKSIAASAASTTLKVDGTTRVSVSFNPSKASNRNVIFSTSDAAVATVDAQGLVTARAAGAASITATSCDNGKAKATVAITVEKAVDPRNSGTVDVTKAARGEATPGLATIAESVAYNPITLTDADRSTEVTVAQKTVPFLSTSDYGKDVDLQMEILTPSTASAASTPLIVWINGGGFTRSDPAENLQTRLQLAKMGYVVASVQHRTSAVSQFPAALQDIKAGIRFLKANAGVYKFNKNMVAVGGNSSGGYYATMVGVTGNVKSVKWPNRQGVLTDTALDVGANLDQSSAVNAVIDFYGVSDLTIIGANLENQALAESHKSAATTEALLLNGAAAAQKGVGVFDKTMQDKVAAASPFTYIDGADPEFIIFHGTADTLVSPVASKMLQNRLAEAGVGAERYVLSGAPHGGNLFFQPYVTDKLRAFLGTHAQVPVADLADNIEYVEGDSAKGSLLEYGESGNGTYKVDAKVPTLAEATAGAENVTVDSSQWVINQAKDITYKTVKANGTYTNLKMNLLIPSKPGDNSKRPVLYMAACGGFNKSNPNALSYLRYAERGYIVAIAEIRVVPNVTMPAPIQDGKAGIRWLRAHADDYNIDSNCMIGIGTSAGGYMAVMLGVLGNTTKFDDKVQFDVGDNLEYSSALQGMVDLYGVSDLTIIGAGLPNYDVHDSESNTEALLVNGTAFGANPGGSIFSDLDSAAKFSPFTYIDENDAPFLMLHGDDHDMSVSPVSTMELMKRLKAAGVQAERYTLVGAGHGGWQFQTAQAYKLIDDFMDGIVASAK